MIPASRRRGLWQRFNAWLGTTAPPLHRPRPIQLAIAVISLHAFIIGLWAAWTDEWYVVLGFLASLAIAILLYLVTTPFCVIPPANLTTFGDLTRRVTGLTASTNPPMNPDEAFAALREIIVDALGVKPEQVVPTARFV